MHTSLKAESLQGDCFGETRKRENSGAVADWSGGVVLSGLERVRVSAEEA